MFFKRKCKITFIKHGATINTEENRFFDDENFPAINETGKSEMEKISHWMDNKGLKIDKIYSASALRCTQSAEILSTICRQDFEILDSLSSRKMGIWSGLSLEEISKNNHDEFVQFFANPQEFTPENGESLLDFNKRVDSAINEIIQKNQRKRLVIITHGEVIQAAIANALQIPLEQQFKTYIPAGSATQITYFEGWASLIYSAYIPS